MITPGVHALGPAFVMAAIRAVAAYDGFSHATDPRGEHEFGALTLLGVPLFFKIYPYDRTLTTASPDPTNSAVTVRVLTILLAEEQ
jgi:hypothetical protein